MTTSTITDPKVGTDPLIQGVLNDVARIAGSTEQRRAEEILRKAELFGALEDGDPQRKLICYLSGPAAGGIDLTDAAPLGSMLDAIGDCDRLDLMINSPGGFGEAAEKLVEMCRNHARFEFRVIVPNYAKSAATMIALGGDKIVMGYLSELGPTDPQFPVAVAGVTQLVSGQSFIQAFDLAQEKVKESIAKNESPVGYLQSLSASTMEPAFIEHCRRGVAFSRDIAKKFLTQYQIPAMLNEQGETRAQSSIRKRASRVAENLLSEKARFSHGRLISGEEARDEVALHVEVLDRDDPQWLSLWELYVRAEVYMQTLAPMGDRVVGKLFFDRVSTLPAY
jgi:hypothetical protein